MGSDSEGSWDSLAADSLYKALDSFNRRGRRLHASELESFPDILTDPAIWNQADFPADGRKVAEKAVGLLKSAIGRLNYADERRIAEAMLMASNEFWYKTVEARKTVLAAEGIPRERYKDKRRIVLRELVSILREQGGSERRTTSVSDQVAFDKLNDFQVGLRVREVCIQVLSEWLSTEVQTYWGDDLIYWCSLRGALDIKTLMPIMHLAHHFIDAGGQGSGAKSVETILRIIGFSPDQWSILGESLDYDIRDLYTRIDMQEGGDGVLDHWSHVLYMGNLGSVVFEVAGQLRDELLRHNGDLVRPAIPYRYAEKFVTDTCYWLLVESGLVSDEVNVFARASEIEGEIRERRVEP